MPSFDSFRSTRPNIRRAPVVGNGDILSPQQVNMFNASQGMQRNQAFLESRQPQAQTAPRQAPVSRYSQGTTPKAQPGVVSTGKPIYHVQRPDGSLVPVAAISGDRALIDTGKHFISPSTGKRYVTDPASPTGMRDIGTEADEIAAKQAAAQAKVAAKAQVEATKAAEKGADEATKLAHAQKANEFLAQGRAFYHDKVTGEPRAKTSDEEWKAAQAEKGAKLQEAAATKTRRAQLAKLEFDAAQVNIKDKELDDADEAVASAKEAIAALRTQAGMTEEDAYTKPFDDAELSTPQGAALTAAEAKKKELAAKIATRDALKQQIAEARLRIDNPEAYAQVMAEKVKGEAPEALDAREKESAAQIEATKAEITAKQQKLNAEEQRLAQSLAIAQKRYDEAKTTGNPAILSTAGEALQDIEAEAQAFQEKSQALRDQIAAEVDEVNRDVQHLNIVSTEKASRRKNAIDDTANAFESALPGMGTELRSVLADGEARTKALQAKYKGREDAPEAKAAFEALQADISGKTKLIEQQVRDSATERQAVRTAAGIAASKFQQGEDKLTKESPTSKFGAQFTMSQKEWNAAQAKTQEGGQTRKLEAMKAAGLDPKNKAHVAAFDDAAAVSDMAPLKFDLTKPLKSVSADTVRTLSDGSIAVNPSLIHNPDRYLEAVELSDGTPEAKAKAIEALPELQLGTAKALLPALKSMMDVPGLESFAKWTAANKPEGDEAHQADAYLKAMQARGYWSKLVDSVGRNAIAGLAYDLPAMIVGTAGLVTGSETLSKLAGESTIGGQRLTQTIGAEGGESDLSTKILAQTARMAGPMAAQVLLTRGLMGPVSKGVLSAGQKAGVYGGAAAQTAGLQYAGTYQKAREAGKTHGEAWLQTAPWAIASGLVTAMLTAAGGSTGFEKLMQKGGGKAAQAGNTFWQRLKGATAAITKEAAAEIPEELPDELFSQISEALASDPDADVTQIVAQFIQDAPALIGSVALMGGAGGIPDARRALKGGQNAGETPDGPLPEDVAGIEASIKAFAPTAPEAIQAMPAVVRTGPKNQLPSEITAKARAAMGGIAKVASGEITKPSQLTETQMRALGVKLDKGGKLVPATSGQNAVAPLIYTRPDKAGNEQLVITDEARTWLQGALPDLAIGQSEAERIQAIENPPKVKKPRKQKPVAETAPVTESPAPEAATVGPAIQKGAVEGGQTPATQDAARKAVKDWHANVRNRWNSDFQEEAAMVNPAFNAVEQEGFDVQAHGMAKLNPTQAIDALLAMFEKGLDPNRGREGAKGTLDTANLTNPNGQNGGMTAGGAAYRDGAFILVQKQGPQSGKGISDMSQVAAVLVNPAMASAIPAIQAALPGVLVTSMANVAEAIKAAKASTAQTPATTPTKPATSPSTEATTPSKLPRELASAKPRYSYFEKQFTLEFENDADRAAYISVQPTPSKRDAEYLAFAMQATGMTAEEVRNHGVRVRGYIKTQAKNGKGGETLAIPSQSNTVAADKKELWQMTLGEALGKRDEDVDWVENRDPNTPEGQAHREAVEQAIADGKPVPQKVLKAYPWAEAARNIKPYVESLRVKSDKELKAEEKRTTAELNKVPKLSGKLEYFEVSGRFNAVNREIEARKSAPDKPPAKGGELIAQADDAKISTTYKTTERPPADIRPRQETGGALIQEADRQFGEYVAKETGERKQRAAKVRVAIVKALKKYNGHLPIRLMDGDVDMAFDPSVNAVLVNPTVAIERVLNDAVNDDHAVQVAEDLLDHEIIHRYVVGLIGDARVMDVWERLPEASKAAAERAYSLRVEARTGEAFRLGARVGGHEYYRMMVELTLKGRMTEETIGRKLLAEWQSILNDILSFLRDLRKQFAGIQSESARKQLIADVEQDIKLVTDAIAALKSEVESISPGAEPAQVQDTGAESISGKPASGSGATVATPVSIKSEKESSAKPWQMTRTEFIEENGRPPRGMKDYPNAPKTIGARISTLPNGETWNTDEHGQEVYAALLRGENVPAEVLAEYPMLQDVKATTQTPQAPTPTSDIPAYGMRGGQAMQITGKGRGGYKVKGSDKTIPADQFTRFYQSEAELPFINQIKQDDLILFDKDGETLGGFATAGAGYKTSFDIGGGGVTQTPTIAYVSVVTTPGLPAVEVTAANNPRKAETLPQNLSAEMFEDRAMNLRELAQRSEKEGASARANYLRIEANAADSAAAKLRSLTPNAPAAQTTQQEKPFNDETRIKMVGVWYGKKGNTWVGENGETPSPVVEQSLNTLAANNQGVKEPVQRTRDEQQKTFVKFKRALTKAVNAKDYAEIIRQADAFNAYYESGPDPFPDSWANWERHKADAEFQLARQGDAPLRPLVVPVLKPTTPPRPVESADADYLKAQEDARAALGGLFASPTVREIQQLEVPAERFDAVRKAAVSILSAKIRTPEGFAKFMDDTFPGGKARPYSEAIWDMMGIADKSLRGSHDWTSIYAGIDKPLPEVEDSADEPDMVQRPDGVESGNADSTGDTGPESGSSGGRMGSDESSAPETDGSEQPLDPEGAGSSEPTGTRGGKSGSGRNDAPIGPGDRGDVRGESQSRLEATANYTITDADKIGEGGLKTKYADNVAAIRLVKQLQAENRKPTTAEQKVLVRYVGWGGMKNVFDGTNAKWADQHKEVKDLLSDDEFTAARRSTMDAHYTSPTVIKNGIWGALKRFGFTGGKMLEGGVGIGHMIGLMPGDMRPASSYLGIEKDPITAQIATYLYPEASIHSTGFEQATVERDHFDAAAGNPPFGQQQLYDPNFKAASKFSIHNYFIAKHIEALRVGGVGAWVVSHNFLDSLDPAAREYIASKAEFLGAIRLPNTAFKANANTEVTTDIVYFRRVPEGTATDTAWTKSTKQSDKDGNTYSLNDWINNHRDMILGTLDTTGSMYGPGELTVTAPPAQDLALDLAAAVEHLPADVYDSDPSGANIRLATPEFIPVPDGVRVGAYFIGEKGELRRRLSDSNMESRSAPVEMPEGTTERVRGMVELRDAFNKVVAAELDNSASEQELDALRAEMNRVYDAFVKKHGLLHQTGNRRAFFSDPHAARILGLESDYDAGVSAPTAKKNNVPVRKPSAKKADIFTRRVNSPYSEITKVETAKEALTVALNQRGLVDLDYMTQLSGIDRDTLLRELDGLIFETPQGEWQVASQYLSGNVRKKLAEAKEAAKGDSRFNANVEALEKVQPPDLEATQVTVTPGAPWVMSSVLKQFALDLTGEDATAVVYNSANGGWVFTHPSNSTNATQVWGTPKAGFETLFTNILNNKPTIIHLPRGKDEPLVVDAQNTALAQAKSDAIRDKWATWIWEDQARREALLKIYNDKFNVYVDPKYDGSHLTLPGISNVVTLRPHQKDVVWRIMTDLTTLLDHVVGAGKTFAGVAAFMELRRLGRVRKPMFAVPNHLVTQWRDDFVKLYPNANVLFARPSDFKKDKRQQLFAKIMTGEYDAVIVGHSSLKKIRMSPEIERELLNEMLTEITDTLKAVADAEGKRGSRAQTQLERQKEALEAKLARLADIGSGDEVATFEELGIDGLFVDEAHEFKNLFYTTQMQNVAGLGNPAGSAKAFDLYLKSRHLRKRYGGKAPLVFATGTPISNSLVEMFTMQRYLQPDVLDSMGIKTLDAWAKVFATVKQVYEVNPTGTGMRLATRLAQFQNVGDLSAVYRTVADVITMSDLFAQAEAQGKKFPIPKVKGGKPQIYAVERTPEQEKYFGVETQKTTESGEPIYDGDGNPIFEYPEGSINWRVDNMPDDPREDNMLKLTSDARKAALDMRLVDSNATDHPESKINTTVRNILATAKQWDAQKGTQLVFCDLSIPSSAKGKAKAKAVEALGKVYWRPDGRNGFTLIEKAEPVTMTGFDGIEFFVYKDARRKQWAVVERSTGMAAAWGGSKGEVIATAQTQLDNTGRERLDAMLAESQPDEATLAAFLADQEERNAEKETASDEADVADDTETTVSMDELLAEESKFSVYDDLKAKLIAGGMAPNQVEFIHDHDTPEKKAILFARMNKGDVRVLIGSTPKLGAGTNVQKKLVALHHMDAPWRPSDLEQREGRIIRQGNEFYEADPEGFEVGINRYATKMTYDTRMWQIIEHKAAGIEGFRRAERTTRVLEDVSGEAANAAEMKAASSGDPRIAREIMLRGDIAKLQALFDGWRQNRYRTESKINALNDHPRTHDSLKKNREELIAKRDAATTDEFTYQLPSGKKVDKKADILAPIAEIVKAAPYNERVAIGRYRGFMFAVERRKYSAGDYFRIESAPIGALSVHFCHLSDLNQGDDLSATGLIQRFDNYLATFEGDITRDAAGVVRSLKESAELKETLKEGFKDEGKLESMKAEHAALRAELMQSRGKRAAPSAAPTSGAVDVIPKEAWLNMIDEAEGRGPLQASPTVRPIASVIQSFEAAFPTFSTYMDENQTPAVRKEALRKIVKAESADVQAWREFANLDPEQALPEDAEAIREAKELLPEVERMQSNLLSADEARLLLKPSGKEGGQDPRSYFIKSGDSYVFERMPLSAIEPNEQGERYDSTVREPVMRQYAATPTEFPPVILTHSKRAGGWGIRDGGHRISAARLRGDTSIDTLRKYVEEAPTAPKVSIPDLHAAFVQAKRQQGTDSPTIRAVFDAAKVKNPRLSRQEFISAIRNGHYTGLVTLRDGKGSIQVGGKGAMTLLPITEAEIIDAAENATETPEAILADWAATEDAPLQASPTNSQNPNTTELHELRQTLDPPPDVFPIPPERLAREAKSLVRWATENGRIIDESAIRDATNRHDGLGGGEEHDVWLPSQAGGRVVKLTKGKLWGIQHSLARYLDTLAESNNRFGDDIRLEGVVIRDGWPHILISQPFYEGAAASKKEIDTYFTDSGYGPFRNLDAMYTNAAGDLVYDAFGRNVFKLADGSIMPIDVQVKVANQEPLQASPTASRDAEYLAAVEAGDMETAQRMVDEAAKAAGFTVEAHHGTPYGEITVFDETKSPEWYEDIGEDDEGGNYSPGTTWFSSSKFIADGYAGGLYAQKAGPYKKDGIPVEDQDLPDGTVIRLFPGNGAKSILLTDEQVASDKLPESALTPTGRKKNRAQLQVHFPNGSSLGGAIFINRNGGKEPSSPQHVLRLAREVYNLPIAQRETSRTYRVFLKLLNPAVLDMNGEKFARMGRKADAAKYNGHDGIVVQNVRDPGSNPTRAPIATTYGVFSPSQIKSADPVTRDESGAVILLSQRFNPASDSILYATPTDKKPRRTINPATQGDTPTTESNRANPGDSPLNRRAAAHARAKYEAEEMTQANFDELRSAVAKELERDFDDNLEDIQYKISDMEINGGGLSIEDQEKVRQLANKLSYRGRIEGDRMMREQADRLYIANADIGSELARGMGLRRDQFKTPQERLDDAMGNILAPSQEMIRQRTINVKTKKERNAIISEIIKENDAKIDAILKRMGLTQADLFLSVDDRHAMQEAVLEMTRAHMGQQSDKHKKAIEMSVRGYSDNAIAKETGLPVSEVSNTAEHFRNVVAKQAIAKDVQAGGTFSKIVQQGKKLISWILQASPTAPKKTKPLGNLVAKGSPTAAAVAAQIQAILNASIPTKGQRNAMNLKSATAKGKNGQRVKVLIPYDPSDWKQVYRVARELSTREATYLDKVYEYWINGILSGPQTHVVNTASNLLSTTWAYGPQWFAEATANVLIRNPESPQFGEFRHVFAGFWKGIMPAVRNFALAWSSEADPIEHQYLDKPVTAIFHGGNLDKVGGIRPSIGFGGRIVRMPGRFLIAQDAFAKTLIMHAESAAMAYRLGKKQGLAGAALENFMASQIATHGSESWQHAFEKSVELTFQDENDITKAVESVSNALKRAKAVGFFFKFLLPFVRTPTNIYRAGIRKAGGSAGMLLYRLGKSGYYAVRGNSNEFRSYREGKMVKDVSETVMALVLWYFIMGMSEGDDDDNQKAIEITGSRPFGVANAGERAAQLRQEGGSNLIIIRKNPITGEKLAEPLRLPYGRYEPIALAVSTLVDGVREFKEWARLKPQDRTTNALAGSITKHLIAQAKDKTFLQGISGFMDFLEDMGSKNLSLQDIFMKNLMNGAIPNLIRQPYRNSQDTIADYKKPGEVLGSTELARSLGIGESKINEAGKPVQRGGNAVTRVLFPVPSAPSTSLFDAALKKWNATNPDKTVNPDPLTRGDFYIYDPKQGSKKGKYELKDSRQISYFEKLIGLKFARDSARELVKLGYRQGQPVTEDMINAIKKARTDAITTTRQKHPREFNIGAKP